MAGQRTCVVGAAKRVVSSHDVVVSHPYHHARHATLRSRKARSRLRALWTALRARGRACYMAKGMGEEFDGSLPGPLDQLAPGLRRRTERWPALPVHPRVVHARTPTGERSIVLASFRAPPSARALHAALKPQVEAALLMELSRPPAELAAEESPLCALELYTFAAFPFDGTAALAPFAFAPAALDHPDAHRALALLRHEAQLVEGRAGAGERNDVQGRAGERSDVEGASSDEPCARFRAPCARASHPLAAPLARGLRERAHAEAWGVWGSSPGQLARACVELLAALGEPGIEPTREGIERLEAVVVPDVIDALRWIDPLSFQALCDLVAAAATASFGRAVEWGVCEPDDESGLAPPPVLRVEARDGGGGPAEARGSARERDEAEREHVHVPLGEHVLRWCVMPRRRSEQIPTLGAWAEHEFA